MVTPKPMWRVSTPFSVSVCAPASLVAQRFDSRDHLQFSSILPSISCQTSHPTFCSCHQLCALFSHSVTVGHFTFTFGNREKIWIRLLVSCASRTSTSIWSVVLAWKTHFFRALWWEITEKRRNEENRALLVGISLSLFGETSGQIINYLFIYVFFIFGPGP